MNEIVKYHNNFNSVALKNFNGIEIDLLMAICSKLKNEDTNEVELKFSDLRRMINSRNRGELRFIQNLEQMYKKLISLSIRIETEDKIINFILFTKYEILKKQKTILIKINEEFKFLLNKFINNFTRFELNEFISLKSSYSKEIYRRLKQFKHTGIWKVQIDNFRELLNIPEKYRISEIDKKVLKISIEELNKYFDNFEIIKIKKGRKIEYLEFKFSPEKKYKENIAVGNEGEDNNNPFPLRKPRKQKKEEEIKIAPARKTRIIEVVPKQEKEKTLREKIEEKISENDEMIVKLEALYTGLKDKVQFKKITEKYPKKIEKIKNVNMQLKVIYDTDENELTQEIIELAEELLANKV
ncbi:replication initiation protein [Leptotrichia trevisanii]|uniref:replication initiation protein n=1 Tax=Leptotrichia trevisanii TaxID=109328 RepID=UPI0026F317C1|nr:replication initiation protein [Leptotrichia trevisanii]